MKKLYVLFVLLAAGIMQNAHAQNSCATPYPVAGGTNNFYTLTDTMPNTDTSNYYGCVSPDNATWFYFRACTSGNINMLVGINNSYTSAMDVDLIVWGPLSAATDCGLNASQVITCVSNIGISTNVNITGALAGQYYKMMLSNVAGIHTDIGIVDQAPNPPTSILCPDPSINCINPYTQQICQVTTDPVTNHNTIIWNKDTSYTGAYMIQKESTTMGVYTTIATVASTDTSVYTDTISNAMVQAFNYRIQTADTCGDTHEGYAHETIHLQVSSGSSSGFPQLAWNPYGGFSYGTYYIYRGSSTASLALYDSISASFTTYTDVNPAPGTSYYAVSVEPPTPCHPTRSFSTARVFSNSTQFIFTGIGEASFTGIVISPNPAVSELSFNTGTNHFSAISFEIYDVTGRRLISRQFENTSSATIDVSSLASGYYTVRFLTEKGAAQRNIIIAK